MENVDIEMLNGFEKEVYIKSLIIVAKADNNYSREEQQFITNQAEVLGLKVDEINVDDLNIEHLKSLADCPKPTRMSIILDSITLGYLDGKYDDDERVIVKKAADFLNISKEEVNLLNDWYLEHQTILHKGQRLLGYID
jgi:uncharacterized tellurite resistance protein B-like protein